MSFYVLVILLVVSAVESAWKPDKTIIRTQNFDKLEACSTVNTTHLSITNCTKIPCQIIMGREYNLTTNFTAPMHAHNLTVVASVNLPIPGHTNINIATDHQVCQHLVGSKCPMKAGSSVRLEYPIIMPLNQPLKAFTIQLEWRLKDYMTLDISCFRIPINLLFIE